MHSRAAHIFALALLCVTSPLHRAAAAEPASPDDVPWRVGHAPYMVVYSAGWNADGRVPMGMPSGKREDPPFGEVTRAYLRSDARTYTPLTITYNKDATEVHLLRPAGAPATKPVHIWFEEADTGTGQCGDGRIVLTARRAKVQGQTAKLESHPGNERIGSWSNPQDFVTWDYKATRPGRYDVFLTYSCAEKSGTKISVEIGGKQLDATLATTPNGWYGYTWIKVGTASIPAAGPQTITLRCREMVGGAVMNLKALTLIPTCEGTPPVQAADGTVTLHARDVTIQGVQVQYEPKPEKNTIGFWTHVTDAVYWDFTITKPGDFDVEILQGCGKGQGGSKVLFAVEDGQGAEKCLVTVKDTGHFQNFVARTAGTVNLERPGRYRLLVMPIHRAGVAVMDLRQVRLLPK